MADKSDTVKEGKRFWRKTKSPPKNELGFKLADPVQKRHTYGHTEKILRRNRKTWTRLLNKRRRALDKAKIEESDHGQEV